MLSYKLIGDNNIDHPKETILKNRGIENASEYLNLTDNAILPYSLLDNIDKAVEMYLRHINNNDRICILQDCDTDGITSAAIIYNYTKRIAPDIDIKYLIHTGKQHGLSPDIKLPYESEDTESDIPVYKNILFIIPDAGSNDVEQCALLQEYGIDVLILDHHECDVHNPYAVVVNNQLSKNYPNKALCGAGVVYKFLQAVDDELWNDYADDYLDLVALGNIADVMDMRSYETRRLVEKGLHNIKNKAFAALIDGQQFSIDGHLNIKAVSWSISPILNAMCRVGDSEEKDIVFRAFIETDEEFNYKKCGLSESVKESIYDRATRLCKNAKARQDKAVYNALPTLKDEIEKKKINQMPVMFVKNDTNAPSTFTGLLAMKLSDYYKRPCLLLRKNSNGIYGGSARNFDFSPITNLKEALTDINKFEFCRGHQGAFGFQIDPQNVAKAMKICSDRYSDIDFNSSTVDFVLDSSALDIGFIHDIDSLQDYYGEGIKSPLVYVTNIQLIRSQGTLMNKEKTTWKFISDDNIAYISFKNREDDTVLKWLAEGTGNELLINAVCEVGMNKYGGILTPQAVVKKYEVV